MKIKFVKRVSDAVTPTKATDGAAGFDLTAVSMSADSNHKGVLVYDTGIAVEIPNGFVGLLFQRSSVYKTKTSLCNAVGVIDSDYRGTIKLAYRCEAEAEPYRVGNRVGQIVFVPAPAVELVEVNDDELSDTSRGVGGYGSTGK
ncbi:MAG: dUTP diphosphatase [Bacilli bacterium]